MPDARPASCQDAETLSEVELCTTLWIASSGGDRPLTEAEIDRLLGVHPRRSA